MKGVLTVAALRTELLFAPRPRMALGMGEAAAPRLVKLLDRRTPAGVLVVGFCGATRAGLPPGTLVLASAVDGTALPQGLVERARERLPGAEVGTVVTVGAPASPAGKARLSPDALAVDMESVHLAAELSSRGIPFLILRCVLDALWEDLSAGPRLRWARRALACARRLGQGARALVPALEGVA
ncbi:hypothetical protein DRJ54_04890 [Candidatus Acetothermia bacterium]|nr:MAG: hypothetical protein DRJ54_04890 [Candidatus Acetothermia bacterium]